MMDFIEGISVDRILQNPKARIMRQDVSENVVETIFRQMVDFLLQLQKLDFSCIGSLASGFEADSGGFSAMVYSRPLTKKSHDFLLDGGVDVFVDDEHDAREKYIYFNVMKSLVSRHVLPNQDTGPFKLICDDLQPTNMIVNNEQDLKIIGVLDWEWSYAAPAQLVSTPWWLLIESPNVWSYIDKRLDRFNRLLELYSRILAEEEPKILGEGFDEDRKPSTMLQACEEDGRQWFHMILRRGFNGPASVPFIKLREQTKDWDELASAIPEEEIEAFVSKKMADLQKYQEQLAEMEERYKVTWNSDLQDWNPFLSDNRRLLVIDDSRRQWQSWACFN
ncbi:hypothetical protein H9Q73_011159 [Fusarium xylarioides]|nr:hypothetical protein H9Q73_011159 [Fusarium xylarioides]